MGGGLGVWGLGFRMLDFSCWLQALGRRHKAPGALNPRTLAFARVLLLHFSYPEKGQGGGVGWGGVGWGGVGWGGVVGAGRGLFAQHVAGGCLMFSNTRRCHKCS